MILIPIFSHKRGQIERNHIKPTIHPPSWWSAWTLSTFKGICTKYTENCVKRDWHRRKQTLFYLLLYFLCRFETKYESNIHRYQDTYLRAFTIVAILGRRLLSTYTTVVLWYCDVCPGLRPDVRVSVLQSQFSTLFSNMLDILSWNVVCYIRLMDILSSSSFVNFRQFLLELCLFWHLEYWKFTIFRTFLLHDLTCWAEMLHMTLLYCTTDQVRVS